MFSRPETCKVCGQTFQRLYGVSRSTAHPCEGPRKPIKVYTEEERKEFERKRKEEQAGKPARAVPKPGHSFRYPQKGWVPRGKRTPPQPV